MLCVSAVFAVIRCLSVCHVGVCIHTAEDIVILLSQPGSPIILVFNPALIPNSKGNPFSGVQNTQGGENLQFSTEITVYLGNGTS